VAYGAKVFATADPTNHDLIRRYGATPIDYKTTPVEKYVHTYTHGEGFDIVLDTVGASILDDSFKAVKQYTGHVTSILGWGSHSLAPLSFKGATYSGVFTLYPLISGKGRKQHGNILREATKLAENKKVIPLLDKGHYSLEIVEDAYTSIAAGKTKGKVVIDIL